MSQWNNQGLGERELPVAVGEAMCYDFRVLLCRAFLSMGVKCWKNLTFHHSFYAVLGSNLRGAITPDLAVPLAVRMGLV